jgi:hypothetical protein
MQAQRDEERQRGLEAKEAKQQNIEERRNRGSNLYS